MKPKFKSRLFTALSIFTCAFSAPSAYGVTETFNTEGTFNWVCPGGVTTIQVECWGGGGAGGSARKDNNTGTSAANNAAGGGGGAYARRVAVPVTAGQTYTFTIPPAAVSGTNGTQTTNSGMVNGGSVEFVGDGAVTVKAAGGGGGPNTYISGSNSVTGTTNGGAAGLVANSIGDVGGVFAGGTGFRGTLGAQSGQDNSSGGGGGGAGNAGAGGSAVTGGTGAAGGTAGGGAGGNGRIGANTNYGVGSPGVSPGGGGGGGKNGGQNTRLGGTGGLGQVALTYTLPVKANNTDDLNLASSWTGGVPTPGIAEWEATVLAANTTVLGGDLTFSGLKISNPGGAVTINAGNILTLGAAAIDIDMSAATQDLTVNCALALGAANVWNVNSGRTLTLGGEVSGAQTVTKQGLGTATLSGVNIYTGNTVVSNGTLNVTGTLNGTSLALGGSAAKTVVNVSNDMTLSMITGGSVANSFAVYNQTAGIVTSVGNTNASLTHVANAGGYGYLNLTGGSYSQTLNRFSVTNSTGGAGGAGVVYVGGTGTLDLTGTTSMIIGYAGMPASLTVGPGGIVNRPTAGNFWLTVNANAYGVLNVAGGDFNTSGSGIRVGNGATSGHQGFVNLAKGTLTLGLNGINGITGANTGALYSNYAGGTLKAAANLTTVVPATNATLTSTSTIFGPITNNNNADTAFNTQIGTTSNFDGGLTVDTNGFAVTYTSPLLGATGNGVKQTNLTVTGGSGYIGAPMVQFTGGTGTPAAGYAVISGGAVTGIVITSPGDYSVDPTGVTLTGGGGTGASVALSALTANTSGGLTKIGAGNLTLTGANTYTGDTLVSVGALKFSTAFTAATNVTVAGSAEAGVLVGVNDEQWDNAGDLTLQNTGAAVIDYGSTTPSISTAPIKVTNFAIDTNAGVRLTSNPASALTVGQVYPLLTWTGSGPTDGTAFTSLTHRLEGSFSVSSSTLFFTVTSNSSGAPISWNTGNGAWDTSSVNWQDANLAATKYFDTLDSVLFGDASGASGNPTVTLATPVSPLSVTMNSADHDYTVSGADSIGGSGSLTLASTNTRTFTLSTANNSFTGGTSVNGGTLVLGDATNTLPDTGAVVVDGATAILSLGSNSDTVGAVSLKNEGSIIGSGTLTGTSFALESGTVSALLGGSGNLAKSTTGTVILSGANTFSGTTSITGGTLRLANTGALANSSAITFTVASSTLELGTDTPFATLPPLTGGSGAFTYSIVSDRATSGAALNHQLGTINFGSATFSFASGTNVASGTAGITFTSATMTSGSAGTAVLNPTSATLTITGGVTSQANNVARTLQLDGTGTGHSIGGEITQAVASALSISKTGTSTWTLSGANSYTGATTVSEGKLILSGARTGTSGAILVSNVAGQSAILDISDGTYVLGANSMNIGNAPTTAASATVNQSGGSISFASGNALLLGQNTVGNTGTYNLSGGSITTYASATRGIMIGVNTSTVGNTTGIFNLSGSGVLNMTADSGSTGDSVLQIGRFDSAANDTIATFNQTGGTANVGILSIGGNGATGSGISSTMSLTGGTFSANQFPRLALGNTNTASITIGGTAQVTLPAIPLARGTSSNASITFDSGVSGYLRPLASSTTYMQAATFSSANLTANGAKFDTNSFDITIGQALQNAPSEAGTLTKSGAGILTLSGANTYSGNTLVSEGSLVLADDAQLKFVLGATSGSNNSISGAGTATLNGDFVIDTSAADALATGSWTLENVSSLTGEYGSTFSIVGFTDAGSNKWTKDNGPTKKYTFDETTGILTLAPSASYSSWAAINAIGSTPDQDKDGDGVSNAVEYVLGGDVNTNDISKLPQSTISGTNLIFTFLRDVDTIDGSTVVTIEVDTDLSGWETSYAVPDIAAANNPGVTVVKNTPSGFDTITLTVPMGTDPKKFARLNVEVP